MVCVEERTLRPDEHQVDQLKGEVTMYIPELLVGFILGAISMFAFYLLSQSKGVINDVL